MKKECTVNVSAILLSALLDNVICCRFAQNLQRVREGEREMVGGGAEEFRSRGVGGQLTIGWTN